jgi:DNA (cytosine-5)-methyltransferase 1
MEYRTSDLFAADTHASLSASQENGVAQKMTVTSGLKCLGLSKNSGPLGSLEKMLLGTSIWGSTKCSLTWKTKTTPQGRLLFQLAPSMLTIDETEFGLWRTPAADQGGTPKALLEGKTTRPSGHKIQIRLSDQVKMWPTPTAHISKEGGYPAEYTRKTMSLTATASLADRGMWPTPNASDDRDRGHLGMPSIQRRKDKGKQLNLSMVVSDQSGALNPTWVEWLMGFPEGHTDLNS